MEIKIVKVNVDESVIFFFYKETATEEEIKNDIANSVENSEYEWTYITYDEYFEWYDNRNIDPKTKAEILAMLGE